MAQSRIDIPNKLILCIVLLFSISSFQLLAQTIKVSKLGVDQGLSNSNVRDLLTDKYGYKWISTGHGLNKYDGLNFETFRYDPMDTFSLRANSLGTLYEDRDANIWVTVDIGGIAKFDRVTNKFHFFFYDPVDAAHANNYVASALFDSKGRNWIGTRTNINLINEENGKFEPVRIKGSSDVQVSEIYEDRSGYIWLATHTGLFRFDEDAKQFLEVRNRKGGSIISVNNFMEDKQGSLWMTSPNDGIHRMTRQQSNPMSVPSPVSADNFVTNLFQTGSSNAMISILRKGIFQWKNEKWKVVEINNFQSDQLSMAHSDLENEDIFLLTVGNRVSLFDKKRQQTQTIADFNKPLTCFWLDPNSRLWLGTRDFGLYHTTKEPDIFRTTQVEGHPGGDPNYANYIVNLLETKSGQLYFVAGAGLFEFDKPTGSVTHVIDYWNPAHFSFGVNHALELDDGSLLLSSSRGLFQFDPSTQKATRLLPYEGRFVEVVLKENRLWAIGNFGLLLHDLVSNETTIFKDVEEAPESLKTNLSRKLFVDSKGVVWVGTVREGLYRIEKKKGQFVFDRYLYTGVRTSGYLSHTINAIYEDSSDRLWVGGFSTGLLEFDRNTEEFINYTPKGELPIPNIQSIEEADDGCIWMSADNGIHKFVYSDKSFKRYTTNDGLRSNSFVLRSSAKSSNGTLHFGSNLGLTSFDPSQMQAPQSVPKVILEQIKVSNEHLPLKTPIPEIESIDLGYNQNLLSLKFVAIDFDNADQITYAYQIDGLNDQWVNLGQNQTVNFSNLGPGNYTFKVRAALNGGVWGEPTAIRISIDPPFWLKPWFFGLIAVLILLSFWLFHQYRLHQKLSRINVMEEVRQNAAADFHDEMGNKLTRIALFSDVLKQKLNGSSKEVSEYVDKIQDNSRNLNSSMRDFLWALDPKKDTAYDVAIMLKDFGEDLFDKTGIEFNVACIESNLERYKLDMDWKRNLIMIFKEAMHNILKHANATHVSLNFALSSDNLKIRLNDNGIGLESTQEREGYGLKNMNYRSKQLAGRLTVENEDLGGTSVLFEGNLKAFSII